MLCVDISVNLQRYVMQYTVSQQMAHQYIYAVQTYSEITQMVECSTRSFILTNEEKSL